ncbi:MAG TPA: polyphosphate kinase 2 family protein [Candidatus Limnocylindrales bacterium]|nr:polyphosphate kinase 2 family protein [Candidatus Limnocylindrales bacterium]
MPDTRLDRIHELVAPLRVKPGSKVRLPKDFDPRYTGDLVKKEQAADLLEEGVEWLSEFQERLAAQDRWSLLVIFQAMDAAGKDGTIRHVMSGVNPQGVEVTSFKLPSELERDHDYLWRTAHRLPARGMIGIFNRSYYEEVLVVRVHPQILEDQKMPAASKGKDVWQRRYREINDWERYLTDNGTKIVKLFLNVSKEEQKERFLDRIEEPESNWKFSASDARERVHWDEYQAAFGDMLSNTSTPWAPWHVIPADRKWFMRLSAAAVIIDALMEIDPEFPEPTPEAREEMRQAKAELLAEDGRASPGTESKAG